MNAVPELTQVDASRARDYVETCRKEAALVPDIDPTTPLRLIGKVGIVGAGTMGGGIAMSAAAAGFAVVLLDGSADSLTQGVGRIRSNYAHSVQQGRLSQQEADDRLGRILATTDWAHLESADLIVECVYEEMELKKAVFKQIDVIAQPGAILATNTSGLDVLEIAKATSRPSDVAGAHFFSPAHVQKLLEVVRTSSTSPDVVLTLMDLGKRMGKVSILSEVYPGFIGNALFRQYIREAHFLVEDGALPHEVDQVMTEFGFAMGVFGVHDLAGNDIGWQMRKNAMATRPSDRRWNDLILELCDMGRFGQKVGKGWYLYKDRSRHPHRDPELERFIVERSARMGISRRAIGGDEILSRCLYAMINEGARLLEQQVALRPGDIDIAMVTGYGYPRDRGGIMYLADQIGLRRVHDEVTRLHREQGFWWTPAPLLTRLAATDSTFGEYERQGRTGEPTALPV
jgi:3-hydroxyacyl-CoA dehydrogenase